MTIDDIQSALSHRGLALLGAFHPGPDDGVPRLSGGGEARTLVLAGNAGPSMWTAFSASGFTGPDALDGWSRHELDDVAGELEAEAVYPGGGPPYWPFQRWAMGAAALYQSPIGILIHPDYGLWQAFRGALLFRDALDLPPRDGRPSPCETCRDKPCLTTCPVNAFSDGDYDVPACTGYLDSPDGADCLNLGCAARRACPAGRDHIYEPAQAHHHMAAFLRNHRG